jgi:hypothetical protein
MKILIVGGTGFIGSRLCKSLDAEITVLTRSTSKKVGKAKMIQVLGEDDTYDVIINLAGEPLNNRRWNKSVKQDIYNSRINATKNIINFISQASIKPKLLINASAVGFYGNSQDQEFSEDSIVNSQGFSHLPYFL